MLLLRRRHDTLAGKTQGKTSPVRLASPRPRGEAAVSVSRRRARASAPFPRPVRAALRGQVDGSRCGPLRLMGSSWLFSRRPLVPDPALIDCRAIICMALQASIRQLKESVNGSFFRECVFALARQLLFGRVCNQTKESTLRGKQQNYKHGCYFFIFLNHLMAGAVWCS